MATNAHEEVRLVPYLSHELDAAERADVERHLDGCAECRATLDDFRSLAAELAAASAPPVHWGAYGAELREKLSRRAAPAASWVWRLRPVSLSLAAGLIAVMVYVGLPGSAGQGNGDVAAIENSMLVSRIDFLSKLDVVQRLDLLEDLDVIGRLDGLPPSGQG